jgi:hypothetical protein
MNAKDQLEQIAKRRRTVGKSVLDAPDKFKICNGCQSLNFTTHVLSFLPGLWLRIQSRGRVRDGQAIRGPTVGHRVRGASSRDQSASYHDCLNLFHRSEENKSKVPKSTRKQISVEDFKKLMTKTQMEAFSSASRVRYGTAESDDYEVVAKHVKMLAAKAAASS